MSDGDEKIEVRGKDMYLLMHPRLTVLVTCCDSSGKNNIITIAWSMPVSFSPPLFAISVSPKRYSYRLIKETGEFCINIPTMEIVKETLYCGRHSGYVFDKFHETRLTPIKAARVKPPLIKECVAHIECRLIKEAEAGDHSIFIGEALHASVNKSAFNKGYDLKKVKPVYHAGFDDFVTVEDKKITPERE